MGEKEQANTTVWSSKSVAKYIDDIDAGIERKGESPFFMGNKKYRKANLLFEYTQEEVGELLKCKNDVKFFANKYAYCKNAAEGGAVAPITLRDYQEDVLNVIDENRFSIILASRQSGKCSIHSTVIDTGNGEKRAIGEVFDDGDAFLSMVKCFLYKLHGIRFIKNITGYLIQFIERIENRGKAVYDGKFIGEQDISLMVKSDAGFVPATKVYKTKPYSVYEVFFTDGTKIECADTHIFFTSELAEVFCKDLKSGDRLFGDGCIKTVKSVRRHNYKFCMYDVSVDDDTHRYYTNGVLSHNTISSSIYLAWYLLFNYDKNVFLTANKERTARDVLSKVQEIIENVPFFMKPGILKWGALDLKFDNGCKCIAESTTPRSGIGFTINLLYLDEFAHVEKGIIDEFYSNIMPTVTSLPDSKIIITSTPNGMNLFYEIYSAAEKGLNGFKPYRIDWWQVPDWDKNQRKWVKRDEEWMERTIAILGGEDRELGLERFGAQYGNSFLATGNLLISPNGLKRMEESKVQFVQDESDIFDRYEIEEAKYLRWHPDINVPSLKTNTKDFFLISVDLSEGNGGDFLVSDIFRAGVMSREDVEALHTPNKISDYVCLEQVGVWAHNYMSLKNFAKFLYVLTHKVMNPENLKIILEWNAFGGEVMSELGYVFGDRNDFSKDVILKFKHSIDSDIYKYGLKVNAENKKIHCQMMRTNTACGRMIIHDIPTIKEFNLFGLRKNSYAAITGHDDLAMTCVNANAFFETRAFGWISDNVIAESGRMQELLDAMKVNGDPDVEYGSIYSAVF